MGSAAQYFEVQAPVEQVYAYWRDFSHFPAFMPDVQEVTVTGPTTSHWKVTGMPRSPRTFPTSASPGAASAAPTSATPAPSASTTVVAGPTLRCRSGTTPPGGKAGGFASCSAIGDAKFSHSFNEVFRSEGGEVLVTPVRHPRRTRTRSAGCGRSAPSAWTGC